MPKCRENWRRKRRRAARKANQFWPRLRKRLRTRKRNALRKALLKLFSGPERHSSPIILNGKIETILPVGGMRLRVRYDVAPRRLFSSALYPGPIV